MAMYESTEYSILLFVLLHFFGKKHKLWTGYELMWGDPFCPRGLSNGNVQYNSKEYIVLEIALCF